MAAASFTSQMATVIGGNSRMAREKDMEQKSGLMETDTSGNSCRVSNMAMEYTEITVEMYTMDNGNKITKMVMDISGGQMATNTMVSTKMI
jgi:hypothetical protein